MNAYQKIQNLCKEHNITITKLEEACELSQNSIKKWDKRNSLPSGEPAIKIARYFGVTTDYLLGLSESPARPLDDFIMQLERTSQIRIIAMIEELWRIENGEVPNGFADIRRKLSLNESE